MPLTGIKRTAVEAAVGAGTSYLTNYAMGRMFPYGSNRGLVTGGPAGAITYTKERHRVGRRRWKKSVKMADIQRMMNKYQARWQLCSPNLRGPGRISIGFGGYTATDGARHSMPIHFMSLTQNPMDSAVNESVPKGCYNHGLYRVIRNAGNGTLSTRPFQCNTYQGVTTYDTFGRWQTEKLDTALHSALNGHLYHQWTSVRMNLYGAKNIPLTYTISVLQMPKNYSPYQHPPTDASVPLDNFSEFNEFTRMIQDISRGLIANPLNVSASSNDWKKNVRIVKQKRITIQPLSYTNAAAETSSEVKCGNVRQFNMFLRHDRWRNYSWADRTSDTTVDRDFADLGWDVTTGETVTTDVSWEKRLVMMITCTVGQIRDGPQNDVTTSLPPSLDDIPSDFGTYDIIVRNSFKQVY